MSASGSRLGFCVKMMMIPADAVCFAAKPQAMDVDQPSCRVGELPVAVDQSLGRLFERVAVLGGGKRLVVGKALRDVGHVGRGQERRRMEIDVGRERKGPVDRRAFAALQGLDCLHEHAVVKVVADFGNFAALVFAQNFARAADFEVVHGEVEA